jgi:tetrahydrodipicolinate N-succinyltransferase
MTRIANGVEGVGVNVAVGIGVSLGTGVGVASGVFCPQATRMAINVKLSMVKVRVRCTSISKE